MYTVAFIFEPGAYDAEFHALDAQILQAAEAIDGYLGKESWRSVDGETLNSTYYWEHEASLKAFSSHPKHLEAKRQYQKWYKGFHVVIAKIQQSYGDGVIPHITRPQVH
jgi:heme-degrading monooxygenase HmoA